MSFSQVSEDDFDLERYRPSLPSTISPRVLSLLQEPLNEAREVDADYKRKASKLSIGSTESQASDFLDIKADQINNADRLLKLSLETLRKEDSGEGPMTMLKSTIQDCLVKRARLAAEDVAIRQKRRRILEMMAQLKATKADIDWADAYASIITQEFKGRVQNCVSESRDPVQQAEWRDKLQSLYNSRNPDPKHSDQLWCPVLKKFGPQNSRVAAHIVPYGLGPKNFEHLFGESDGKETQQSLKNGLVISRKIEIALERFWIAIVPVIMKSKNEDWKVVLMDESKRNQNIKGLTNRTWGSLDNQVLQFCSDYRPGKRYLYYQFVIGMLVAIRFQTLGWEEKKNTLMTGEVWATPGRYLHRSILARLGYRLGDVSIGRKMLDSTTFDDIYVSDDEAETIAKDLSSQNSDPNLIVDQSMAEWEGFSE